MSDDQHKSKAQGNAESGADQSVRATDSATDATAPQRFYPEVNKPSSPTVPEHDQPQTDLADPGKLPTASDETQPNDLVPDAATALSSVEPAATGESLFIEPTHAVNRDDVLDLLSIDWDEPIPGCEDPTDRALTQAFAKAPERAPFVGFDTEPDGERAPFSATLTQAQLLLVDSLLLATYDEPRKHPSLARIVVFGDGLLIQANSVIALLQHRIHLEGPTGLPSNARATFYVATLDLHQAMKACGASATLAWESGEALTFSSGDFERDLCLRPTVQFQKLSAPIVAGLSLTPTSHVPIDALSEALRYTWPLIEGFNKRSVVSAVIKAIGDCGLSVGRPDAMAVVSSPSSKGFVYSIRGKQAKSLKTALMPLQHPIELFQDSRHHILWDGVTAIGFDQDLSSLQQAREKWDLVEWKAEILVPRKQLTHLVRHVAVLSAAGEFELKLKGAGKIAITVSAASGPRRRARSSLEGVSQAIIPVTRLRLPVWPMLAALQASDSANTCLRVSSLGLMVDDSDGRPSGRHFIHAQKTSSAT